MNNRVLMLLEKNPYPQDVRVRHESLSLTKAGYQVSVIGPRHKAQSWYEEVDGVNVYRFPAPSGGTGLWTYIWEYGCSLIAMYVVALIVWAREGVDVVHFHNPPDLLIVIAAFFKPFGKRVIYDHHDLMPDMYKVLFPDGSRFMFKTLRQFEKLSCRLADRVLVPNLSYKEVDIRRNHIDAERITVVRNGPDPSLLKQTDPHPDLQWPNKIVLGYLGDIGYHDGLDAMMSALHDLVYKLQRTNYMCVIVGDGDAWEDTKRMSERLNISAHVTFTGRVPYNQVADYLSAADICLAPEQSNSYNDRSTVNKIMEYMAVGKPIVAFDLPEHRFSAQDAAVYATSNDTLAYAQKIADLMDAPEKRARMGKAGRNRVENVLAWPYQAQNLLAAYEAVLNHTSDRIAARYPEVG